MMDITIQYPRRRRAARSQVHCSAISSGDTSNPLSLPCTARWYRRFFLSYRDVEELLTERGLPADHTTIWRWVQCYAPALHQRCRRELNPTNGSWRVDET